MPNSWLARMDARLTVLRRIDVGIQLPNLRRILQQHCERVRGLFLGFLQPSTLDKNIKETFGHDCKALCLFVHRLYMNSCVHTLFQVSNVALTLLASAVVGVAAIGCKRAMPAARTGLAIIIMSRIALMGMLAFFPGILPSSLEKVQLSWMSFGLIAVTWMLDLVGSQLYCTCCCIYKHA